MDTSTRFIRKYPKSLTSGIGFIVKIVTWLLLASRYLYVQLHHRLFTTSTSFAHWPPRLRSHCVAVTLHISGTFRYPLSVPVHSSPSREISSRSHLSRKTPHGASSSSSMPKSTRSSYIWLLDTEMEKGSLCSVSLSLQMRQYFTHVFPRATWIHGITITPTTSLNIRKKSWQHHLGKSTWDQHKIHFCAAHWRIYTHLCGVIWFAC